MVDYAVPYNKTYSYTSSYVDNVLSLGGGGGGGVMKNVIWVIVGMGW